MTKLEKLSHFMEKSREIAKKIDEIEVERGKVITAPAIVEATAKLKDLEEKRNIVMQESKAYDEAFGEFLSAEYFPGEQGTKHLSEMFYMLEKANAESKPLIVMP